MREIIIGFIIVAIILVLMIMMSSPEPTTSGVLCYDGFGNTLTSTSSTCPENTLPSSPSVSCYDGHTFVSPVISSGEWVCPSGSSDDNLVCRTADGDILSHIGSDCPTNSCVGYADEKDLCYNPKNVILYRPTMCGSDGKWMCNGDDGTKKFTYKYKGCSTASNPRDILGNMVYNYNDPATHPGYFGWCISSGATQFNANPGPVYRYSSLNSMGAGCFDGDDFINEPNNDGSCSPNDIGDMLGDSYNDVAIYELVE